MGELPGQTAVACLVLGARYPGGPVFAGTAAAFRVRVAVAVALGGVVGRGARCCTACDPGCCSASAPASSSA